MKSKETSQNEFDDLGNEFSTSKKWYHNSTITKFTILPAIILFPFLIFSQLYPDIWFLNDVHHFYFEIIAVIFDSLIAAYCLARYKITREKLFVFLIVLGDVPVNLAAS